MTKLIKNFYEISSCAAILNTLSILRETLTGQREESWRGRRRRRRVRRGRSTRSRRMRIKRRGRSGREGGEEMMKEDEYWQEVKDEEGEEEKEEET